MKVLVVGGTSTMGGAIIHSLRNHGVNVRCMSRYANKINPLPNGVESCFGDLDKPSSLAMAFDKVDGVFLMTPLSRNETQQGLAAVEAAKAAGVRKLVYLSVPMPPGSEKIPHYHSKIPIEQAIKASGVSYTLLRPNNFFQNDFLYCRAAVMSYGVYPQPIGSAGLNRVDIRDVAEAATNALIESGHDGNEYPLHGPDALTGESVAATFSKHLGRQIRYTGNDLDEWAKQSQHMMPEWMVKDLRAMYEYFQQHGVLASARDFAQQLKILKHEPRGFDAFVAEILPVWRGAIETGGR